MSGHATITNPAPAVRTDPASESVSRASQAVVPEGPKTRLLSLAASIEVLWRERLNNVQKIKTARLASGPEQIKFLLGHSSIQTTERYLGSEQEIAVAVNDAIGL